MKSYTITAHLGVALKKHIQTPAVRFTVPAASEAEAREKAKAFLLARAAVIIEGCAPSADTQLDDMVEDFKRIFNLK